MVAIQNRLGIPYKDSCSRVYHQQEERLKIAEQTALAWNKLKANLDCSLVFLQKREDLLEKYPELKDLHELK